MQLNLHSEQSFFQPCVIHMLLYSNKTISGMVPNTKIASSGTFFNLSQLFFVMLSLMCDLIWYGDYPLLAWPSQCSRPLFASNAKL